MTSRSGRFLKFVGENFLSQVLRQPSRKDAPLDLLVGMEKDSWGRGWPWPHEMVAFKTVSVMRKKDSRAAPLDLKRANAVLFREGLSRVPWESAAEGSGVARAGRFLRSPFEKRRSRQFPWVGSQASRAEDQRG